MYVIRLLFLVVVVVFGSLLFAQEKTEEKAERSPTAFYSRNYGIGVVTNLPKEYAGLGVYSINDGTVGVFFDIKGDFNSPEDQDNFYSNISVNMAEETFGDGIIKKKGSWLSINGGLTLMVTTDGALYGGLGVSYYSEYRQYYDPTHILGDSGKYWIDNPKGDKTYTNFLCGIILKTSPNMAFQIGYESKPSGVTVGLSFLL